MPAIRCFRGQSGRCAKCKTLEKIFEQRGHIMKNIRQIFLLVVVLFLAHYGDAFAQPDAGTLLQEQRQMQPSLPDRLPAEEKKDIEKPPLTDTGIKILVKSFLFTGNYEGVVTEAELQELVKDSIGKELGFAELRRIAEGVTSYLREKKGFLLARAYLPQQDITEGIVEIAIVAGRTSGKVQLHLKQPNRIRPSVLQNIADQAVPGDSPVRMDKIERAVLLMNDLPGINAQASLEAGETPGSTRLAVHAAEGRLFQAVFSGDNFGDRYTGAWRGNVQVSANDSTGFGDQITLSGMFAEHTYQGRFAWSIPLGPNGLSGNIYYSYMNYELGEELKAMNAKGWASTPGAGVSYPLLRSRSASIWSGLGFEYLMLDDEANGAKVRKRELAVGNINLTGSFYDYFGGGGLTSAGLTFYGGSLDLSGLETNKAADAFGPKTHGGFFRGAYSLARLQRVTRELALYASVRGQVAFSNLDSSQKFILGGSSGVRAYPVGESSGDEGHAGTVEARLDLPFMPVWATTQLIGFCDTGWIQLHHNAWNGSITNATGKNDYVLSGGGVGINVGKSGLYSLRASYAHKIGTNDGQTLQGNDADNRNYSGRFWLQLIIWM